MGHYQALHLKTHTAFLLPIRIVYVTVHDCYDVGATVIYAPENENIYHSEIHKDQTTVQLSKGQAKKLAGLARKVDEVAFA